MIMYYVNVSTIDYTLTDHYKGQEQFEKTIQEKIKNAINKNENLLEWIEENKAKIKIITAKTYDDSTFHVKYALVLCIPDIETYADYLLKFA